MTGSVPSSMPARGEAAYLELEAEFSDVLGVEAARKLLSAFAGNDLYVPRTVDENHHISRAIGIDNALIFCEFFFGMNISFPVHLERKRRVIEMRQQGKTHLEITRALLVSRRFIQEATSEFRRGEGLIYRRKLAK